MTFTSTHKEALLKALVAYERGDITKRSAEQYADFEFECAEAMILAYVEERGAKIVPAGPSTKWTEAYCDLTNRDPDGVQSTSSHDGWIHTTFREMAGREISAMLSASPDPFTDEAPV